MNDAITAFTMPLFILQDASVSIQKVKGIGQQQKEQKNRDLVMSILTVVFSVLHFAGPVAQALGGARRLASAAIIIRVIENGALTIAEVINDSLSAPFAVLGTLVGAGGLFAKSPRAAFKDAADIRRALNENQLSKFTPEFRASDALVRKILSKCTR